MYTFSESLILHKRNWGHAGITFLWHFEKFLQVKEARSIRFHGSCINGAHEKMYFVKDICYIFQLLVLAISHPNSVLLYCAVRSLWEQKPFYYFFYFDLSHNHLQKFLFKQQYLFGKYFLFNDPIYFCNHSVLLRILQSLSRMLLSFKDLD